MNQDKIKQAFEVFWLHNPKPGYPNIKDAQEDSWLAACEWLMSQGSEGFGAYRDYLTSGGNFQVHRLDLHEQTWQAAKLSCAKELNEKDKEIQSLKYQLSEALTENEKLKEIIAHTKGALCAHQELLKQIKENGK
jgi:hypothetical protein